MRTVEHLRSRAAVAAAVLLLALLALPGFAARAAAAPVSTPVSGSCPSGLSGLGTAASPCLIGTAAQLYEAMTAINADTAREGAAVDDYELTADIDATTYAGGTAGTATSFGNTENWTGINYFSGVFNGDGHTISNLNYTSGTYTLALPGPTATAGLNLGLFRVLNGATVENLGLHNVRSVSATANAGMGGVAVWSFDSTVSGVALTEPTMSATAGGGSAWVGGLVGLSYANTYAHDTSTISDGGTATFTDDLVSGGSIADANRTGGILGMATGPTTVADDYVNTTLSNPVHPVAGAGGQANTYYYVIGGLVGEVGATYTTSAGATAAPVAMTDNVIQGTIKGLSSDHRSFEDANFASATVGYATVEGHVATSSAPNDSNWTTSNNLVSSAIQYTNETGSGLPGADGTSVSPATLETEATYSGTATGLTDPTTGATYDQLGWTFGGGGTSATSGWGWTGTKPIPVVAPTITVAKDPIAFLAGSAPAASTVEAEAGAATNFGTLAIEDAGVDWSTAGTYTVTLTASNHGFTTTRPLTILVASGKVPLADDTIGFETSGSAPSTAEVLKALGAALPQGDGGTLAVDYPDGTPVWSTPGQFPVEVVDDGGSDGLAPATAMIEVVSQPSVTVTNSTVSFRKGATVTAQEVIEAAEPKATYSSGDSGSFTADVSEVGSAVGEYTATITAVDKYGIASAPATVTVAVVEDKILLGHEKAVFQATSSAPSEETILEALAPVMPPGAGGHPTAGGYTAADFETPGQFSVTVSDSDGTEEVGSVEAVIEVVPVAVISDTASTVYFNVAEPPTAEAVIEAAGAQVTAEGLPAPGSTLEATLPSGCGTTAGTCTVTIAGTDTYGFAATPASVTVEVSAAAVGVAHSTATFPTAASAPSQAALVSALGATVSGSSGGGGEPVVDASSVDWSVPGTYGVSVSDSQAQDAAPKVTASIHVVPVPVVSLPSTTVYLPVNANDPLPAATLLANSGASLTDGSGNAVGGTLSADTSGVNGSIAGRYSATISGTDEYGFESAPVTVTVVMYLSSQQAGTVTVSGTAAVGATLTASLSGWEGLAAPEYQWLRDGAPITGANSSTYTVTTADAGKEISVQVVEAPQYYERAAATSTPVAIPAASGSTGEEHKSEETKKTEETKPTEPTKTTEQPHGETSHPSSSAAPAKPKLSKVRLVAGVLHLSVKVDGKGTLTAIATSGATKVASTTEKAKAPGEVSLKLALSHAARTELADRNLKITLKVTFKNAAGKTATTTKTVTLRQATH